jgi:hypothetical protein
VESDHDLSEDKTPQNMEVPARIVEGPAPIIQASDVGMAAALVFAE